MTPTIVKKCERNVTVYSHCQKSSRDVAGIVGVRQSTLSRIKRRFEEIGTVSSKRKEKCGRKSKTSTKDDKMLQRLSGTDSKKTISDLKRHGDLRHSFKQFFN